MLVAEKKGLHLFSLLSLLLILVCACTGSKESGKEMKVHIWYGLNQEFGKLGNTQRQINILGNIENLEKQCHVFYILNNSKNEKTTLSIGSDLHRLALAGDFNIDIERSMLKEGDNLLQLIVERNKECLLKQEIHIQYAGSNFWPLPYEIDWSHVLKFQDAVEVIDGDWEITSQGAHIKERYYDRVLAFGDRTWCDYEVATSVVFHNYTSPVSGPPTYNVSHVAIASRWPGHDRDTLQPDRKWFPLGATSEFRLTDDYDSCRWRIFDGENFYVEQEYPDYRNIEPETWYHLKHRVENISDTLVRYSVKFWDARFEEPEDWDLQALEVLTQRETGSALLLAHNTEVTFGNILVTPIEGDD